MKIAHLAAALLAMSSLAMPGGAHAEPGVPNTARLAFAGDAIVPVGDVELSAVTAGASAAQGFVLDQSQLTPVEPWFDYREAKYRAVSQRDESIASILQRIAALVELRSTFGVGIVTDNSQGQVRFEQFETRTIPLPNRALSIDR